ncbi:hypothetical protein ASC64_14955 [Nocardioides sp. Root122]|uniref:hypothetical protein n=1 Tax=Nocardioides TaxID=1839 RepID=UPI000702724D|nr:MULTISPECIES: hypothetical protein [Nocardioides]KQV64997.1 hypothetical protein ASC64_14955 [Nocardioides sp. Root122]MCK9823435.1 hypothetical protein [Nocardioides cavernae]
MVEHLTDLMRAEAEALDIPHPPTEAILRGARGSRRTHILVPGLAAAAAATVVGAFVLLPGAGQRPDDAGVRRAERAPAAFTSAEAAAAQQTYAESGAYAAGTNVYFGDLERGVEIDDSAVRGLYYTSAGLLVRHGKDYLMDGSTPDTWSLVGTDGSVAGLDISLGDVSASTDPTQPYLAYAQPAGDAWEVVVLDLRTGEAVAVVPVRGAFTWGGWDAPPVALSGDHVYVGLDDDVAAVDWRTGDVTATPLPGSVYPDISADRFLQVVNRPTARGIGASARISDARSGEVLLDLPDLGDKWASLSPDGSHVLVLPYMLVDDDGQIGRLDGAVLYSVDTGESTELPASPVGGYGWTPDGSVISVDDADLTQCDLAGCSTVPIAPGAARAGTVRLGGMVNES